MRAGIVAPWASPRSRCSRCALVLGHPLVAAVLAQRDELHLGRHDAAPRVVHLRHVGAGLRAPRRALQAVGLAAQRGDARRRGVGRRRARALAVVHRRGGAAGVGLAVVAPGDPARAHGLESAPQVDQRGRVGVRPRRVVDGDLLAVGERDLAHRHADAGLQALHAHLARRGQRLARGGGGMAAIEDVRRVGGGRGLRRDGRMGVERQCHRNSGPGSSLLAPDGAPISPGRPGGRPRGRLQLSLRRYEPDQVLGFDLDYPSIGRLSISWRMHPGAVASLRRGRSSAMTISGYIDTRCGVCQ